LALATTIEIINPSHAAIIHCIASLKVYTFIIVIPDKKLITMGCSGFYPKE